MRILCQDKPKSEHYTTEVETTQKIIDSVKNLDDLAIKGKLSSIKFSSRFKMILAKFIVFMKRLNPMYSGFREKKPFGGFFKLTVKVSDSAGEKKT